MNRKLILILFLVTSLNCLAQQGDYFFGRLSDENTGEPFVFATIRLQGKALGVISNNDGGFKIPSDFQFKGDSLVISSMGYETKRIDFGSLRENSINQILVKQLVFELSETVVTAKNKRNQSKAGKGLKAEQIIRHAIEGIPDNYDKNPFELVGYYRDYQLQEKKYTNLNEALIKVFDQGFDIKDHSSLQFGLYNYNTNLDFAIDSFAAKTYDYQIRDKYIPDATFRHHVIPNELLLLFNHDAIRNNTERTYSYVNTFVNDFIKAHDFFTYFVTNYGDKRVYKIKFNKNNRPFQVKGDIYIDVDTYAIRKLDYAVYRQKAKENSNTSYSETEMDLLYEVLVEYKEYKEHMYLNYISFHNQFKLVRPPEFFIQEAILDPDTKLMTLVLNKPAANWLTLNNKDFKVHYKKYRLKVKKVVRVGDVGNSYLLSFSKKGKLQRKRLRLLSSKEKDIEKASLKVTVHKMVDADGNFLEERKSEMLNQFREFFTQKIVTGGNGEVDNASLVNKKVPLDNDGQLIRVKKDEEFWMNSPLKKIAQ